jgi:leader peptidase (prepilin peptidase)/N-methyltransferase
MGIAFCLLLGAVTVTDLRRRIIPNVYLAAAAIACLTIALVADPQSLAERGLAALGASGFLMVPAMIHPNGMGMGDVKLAGVMGLYLEAAVIPALLVALVAGGVVGLALLAREGAPARTRAIPFAPFLAAGGIAGLVLGDPALVWWLDELT